MYVCAIVTSHSLQCGTQINLSNFKRTCHTHCDTHLTHNLTHCACSLCMHSVCQVRRLGAKKNSNVQKRKAMSVIWSYFGYKKDYIDQARSVSREVTQLICIYVGTTQQSPARVFANPHPPVSAIFKTTSDPFSDSSTNYIPHPSRHAINWHRRPTRTRRMDASFKNESKLAWGMGVLGGRKHAWMSSYDYHFEMQVYFCRCVANNLQASDPVVQNKKQISVVK